MSNAGHAVFPHIFRPLQIKNVTLRSRIAISGHFAGWWADKGLPRDEFVAYLEERAKGGVGLFVIGATSPGRGVRFWPGEGIAGWDTPGTLRFRALQTGGEHIIHGVGTVVATIGATAVNSLGRALRSQVDELHIIGDANAPQTVEHATYQGARIGRLL